MTGVRIERNRLVAREDGYMRAEGTGEMEVVPCGLVIRSVGYRGCRCRVCRLTIGVGSCRTRGGGW